MRVEISFAGWRRLLYTSIILSQFLLASVFSCSCVNSHPQRIFCTSEYVLLGTVENREIDKEKTSIRIQSVFKGNETRLEEFESFPSVILNMMSLCFQHLTEGKKYVIHATLRNNALQTNLCMGNQLWSQVTKVMKRGFRKYYIRHCECASNDYYPKLCHRKYSYRVKRNNECVWAKTQYFRICQKSFDQKRCSTSVH